MKYVVEVNGERLEVELAEGAAIVDGQRYEVALSEVPGTPVRLLRANGTTYRALARRDGSRGRYVLAMEGWRYAVEALDERMRAIRDLTRASAAAAGPAPLVAPMPGLIVRVAVEPGQQVKAGEGLVVMEAMKMENELRAPADGTVTRVLVQPGAAVEKGAVLVELA